MLSLSARDAVHVAIMQRHRIMRLLSFDVGFDQVGWLERLS
jgi:predicted nucleic acid-binding protein